MCCAAADGLVVAIPASAWRCSAAASSSQRVGLTSSGASAASTERPVTPAPATSTAAAGASASRPASCPMSVADRGQPLAVEQGHTQTAADRGKQPKPDDHRGLGPADELEVMVE